MSDLLIVLVYCLCCTGAGFLALRALAWRTWSTLQAEALPLLTTAFLLGQFVLVAVWLFLALSARFAPPVVWAVLVLSVAGFLFASDSLRQAWQRFSSTRTYWREEKPALRLAFAGAVMLFFLYGLAAFLNPPEGDAEAFYLAYPKIIADSQRLIPMRWYEGFSSIGLFGELHFAALFSISGLRAVKLFVWLTSLAAAAMLSALGASAGLKQRGRVFLFMMLLTTSAFAHHIWDGKVDIFACALGLGAFYWVLRSGNETHKQFALSLGGLLAGSAIIAKFSYLPVLIPGLVFLIAARHFAASRQNNDKPVFGKAFMLEIGTLILWTGIAAFPHLLKNGLLFGEPLAPFVTSNVENTWLQQVWFSPEITRRIILTYPFSLAFGRYPLQSGNISYLVIAFLPLAFFLPRPASWLRSPLFLLTMAALFGTVVWVILRPSIIAPRYILATLLLFMPLAARGTEYAYETESSPRLLRAGILASLFLALVIFSYPVRNMPSQFAKYVKGDFSECELASFYCTPLQKINRQASAGGRVAYFGYYFYWLRPDLLQCLADRRESKMLTTPENAATRWEILHQLGFSYLVLDKSSHAPAAALFDAAQAPDWLKVEKFEETGELLIYRLTERDSSHPRHMACKQVHPPAWDVVADE